MTDVFQPDQVISARYRVLRKLGSGGMADVYLCEDLTLGRKVALKVLLQRFLDDAQFVERFRREAKAAAGLNNSSLVSIYDWGELDGTYYIVMEYVEGETLKELIRRRGRLSGNDAVAICLQLLAAVAYAHRSGIVHRDIKPQNVMLDREGRVKVMDFGIARAGDSGMTEAGSILGTAQYLPPEQARGLHVDERSDLYAVGIVMYEMLTGTVPFKGDSAVTVALKHVNEMATEPAQLVPGLPYSLNQIVLKAIAKDPDDRYQSAEQFARDLRAAQEGGPLTAAAYDASAERTRVMTAAPAAATAVMPAQEPLDAVTGKRRRRTWLIVTLLVLAIAAAAFGLWYVMSGEKVAVPSVVGQQQASAVAAIRQAGLKANVQQEYSDRFAEGFVSRQDPSGGTKVRDGSTIDVWVSQGPTTVQLQDFTGWTAKEVADWLDQNDLKGDQRKGKSGQTDPGLVYKQDPPAGATVKRGDTVTYYVSSGKPQVTVPDLSQMTQAEAQAALADANLALGSVTFEASSSVASGLVIRQDPPADAEVTLDSAVDIVLSSGPSPTPTPTPSSTVGLVQVPNVYGMDAATAADTLQAAGFAPMIKERASSQPAGSVIQVVPEAGTFAAPGSKVTVYIAK